MQSKSEKRKQATDAVRNAISQANYPLMGESGGNAAHRCTAEIIVGCRVEPSEREQIEEMVTKFDLKSKLRQ